MSRQALQPRLVERQFDLLDLHAASPERYPHLLESSLTGPQGRYDILFAFPGQTLTSGDGQGAFLNRLDAAWRAERRVIETQPALPFVSGWFLYLGYELTAEIEPHLQLPGWDGPLASAIATRMQAAVVCEHGSGRTWITAEHAHQAEAIESDIDLLSGHRYVCEAVPVTDVEEEPAEAYLLAVRRILQYIVDGDVFQVNLSRNWQTQLKKPVNHASLYARLRKANPGPFNGMASWGDTAIFSSSPERLVSIDGDRVETRPIAGTRPRSENDQAMLRELLAHPKERAEHIMLIDLERNDLGRIAVPGSVEVNELMSLESYASVHHIVSNVRAQKRPDVSPVDVIRAVFPGGTITGCPKLRCMEIIAELEKTGRGPYTGSMGYLDISGRLDLNILIRTIVRDHDRLSFRAGAGIVADSDPDKELDETRAKASGMLRALARIIHESPR